MNVFYIPNGVKVLRMTEGERFCVTNGEGFLFDAELVEALPKRATVNLTNQRKGYDHWGFNLEIAIAPTKLNERTEWFLEKATEIGIDKVKLFTSYHSERRAANVERFQKVMVAAMKQSIKSRLPKVEDLVPFDKLVKQPFEGQKFIAWIDEDVKDCLCDLYQKGENALVLIGPEGDFSPEEVALAKENGFVPCSLHQPNEMKKLLIAILLSFSFVASAQQLNIALLKYRGGGDWYGNPTSLPNLVRFCNQEIGTDINPNVPTVEPSSPDLFNYPYVYMTGHGNVVFDAAEAQNLRNYMLAGGFLHIDDNYGIRQYIEPQMKKVFPELDFVELPYTHEIFKKPYAFPNGLPKIHEHDNKPPQLFALIYEGRIVCIFTYECDLGDGWEDQRVHHDSQETREKALKMGANILRYVFTK